MRGAKSYLYFIGIRPPSELRERLMEVSAQVQPGEGAVSGENLHLTLCVVAHPPERDRAIVSRVEQALIGAQLASYPIRLGRVLGGPRGASIRTRDSRSEILAFYRQLEALLRACGIAPLHRKSRLNPHVTLGYAACAFSPFLVSHRWEPTELLLIESEIGRGVHNVVGEWSLQPPPQGVLPFAF